MAQLPCGARKIDSGEWRSLLSCLWARDTWSLFVRRGAMLKQQVLSSRPRISLCSAIRPEVSVPDLCGSPPEMGSQCPCYLHQPPKPTVHFTKDSIMGWHYQQRWAPAPTSRWDALQGEAAIDSIIGSLSDKKPYHQYCCCLSIQDNQICLREAWQSRKSPHFGLGCLLDWKKEQSMPSRILCAACRQDDAHQLLPVPQPYATLKVLPAAVTLLWLSGWTNEAKIRQ